MTKAFASSRERFAFTLWDTDILVGIGGVMGPLSYQYALHGLEMNTIRLIQNARFLSPPGTSHTMLFDLSTASGSVTLGDFLTEPP